MLSGVEVGADITLVELSNSRMPVFLLKDRKNKNEINTIIRIATMAINMFNLLCALIMVIILSITIEKYILNGSKQNTLLQ